MWYFIVETEIINTADIQEECGYMIMSQQEFVEYINHTPEVNYFAILHCSIIKGI